MVRKPSALLSYRVLVLDPIPFADPEKTPAGEARMFQPIAVTLITGERDAVLVDPPMTTKQTEAVGQWVEDSGKRLRHRQHPRSRGSLVRDGNVAEAFPRGPAHETARKRLRLTRFHGNPEFESTAWDKPFPGQILSRRSSPPSPRQRCSS